MSSVQEILAGYEGLQAAQEAFYRDLHQHPELSHQEQRTAQRVAGQLQQYGCTVQAGIGGTGVVGMLSNGGGPTVLRRFATRAAARAAIAAWIEDYNHVRRHSALGMVSPVDYERALAGKDAA